MPDLSPRFLTPLHTDNLPAGLLSAAGHESAGGMKEEDAAKLPHSPASTRSPSLMATQEPVPPTSQQAQQSPPAQQLVLDSAQLAQFQLFQEFLQWHQRQQQEGGSSEQQVDQACSETPWQWRSAGQYTWPPAQQPQPPSQQPQVEPHKPAPQSAANPGMKMKLKLSDKVGVDPSGQFVFHLRACAVLEAILFVCFLLGAPVDGGKASASAAIPLVFAAAICWRASRKIVVYSAILEQPDDPALPPGELPPPLKRADLRRYTCLSVLLRVATLIVVSHVVACFALVIVMYGSPLYLLKPRTCGTLAAVCIFTAIGDVYVSMLCWKVGDHLYKQRMALRERFSAAPTAHQEEGRLPAADAVAAKGVHSMEEGGSDEHKWGRDRDHATIVREDEPTEG